MVEIRYLPSAKRNFGITVPITNHYDDKEKTTARVSFNERHSQNLIAAGVLYVRTGELFPSIDPVRYQSALSISRDLGGMGCRSAADIVHAMDRVTGESQFN